MGMYRCAVYVCTAQGKPLHFDAEDSVTHAFADTDPVAAFPVQKIRFWAQLVVPKVWGFTMPSEETDAEVNALFQSELFRPLQPAEKKAAAWAPCRAGVD
eukprot:7139079-Pyramimonas_sp.AAC.1